MAGATGLHAILRSPATWLGTGLIVPILLEQGSTEVHIIALFLGDMGIWSMDGLHMLAERARICVPLGAAWDLADVGFLGREPVLGYGWGPKGQTRCNTCSEAIPCSLAALAGTGGKCSNMFTACGSIAPGPVHRNLASCSTWCTSLACKGGASPNELLPQEPGDTNQRVGKTHTLPENQDWDFKLIHVSVKSREDQGNFQSPGPGVHT